MRKALSNAVPVDERVSDEPTPLMMALAPYIAEPGSPAASEKSRSVHKTQIAKLLLSNGANVRLADGNGMTALHRAVASYEDEQTVQEVVDALLEAGADVGAATCAGETAAAMAERRGRAAMAERLRAWRGDAGAVAGAR